MSAPTRDPDEMMLTLFRQWREAVFAANNQDLPDEEEAQPAHDRVYALERLIYDTPAAGPIGLIIKAYMLIQEHHGELTWPPRGEVCGLEPTDPGAYGPDGKLQLGEHALKGWCEDALRFLPELEPLVRGNIVPTQRPPKRETLN